MQNECKFNASKYDGYNNWVVDGDAKNLLGIG